MWIVETLNADVDTEIAVLPADMRARLSRISALIEAVGLEKVHEPHIKHVEGPLWEMRMKGRDGISRALYVTAWQERVVIVRVFIKKTEKTPRHEIEIALKRAQEVTDDQDC
ncbi:type II toxin-antitoxin system RelE/ParE family toxin [uncultured Lamprocystis sp.]|nr:type II toxin-antitoxin system RelE/ParE family toxin [uncultured Lamprocystis sp.]